MIAMRTTKRAKRRPVCACAVTLSHELRYGAVVAVAPERREAVAEMLFDCPGCVGLALDVARAMDTQARIGNCSPEEAWTIWRFRNAAMELIYRHHHKRDLRFPECRSGRGSRGSSQATGVLARSN
jgi:hypothetical protein